MSLLDSYRCLSHSRRRGTPKGALEPVGDVWGFTPRKRAIP